MKYEEIENTPFVIAIDEEKEECYMLCQRFRLTPKKPLTEKEKMMEEFKQPTWNNLLPVIQVVTEYVLETKKSKQNGRD